MAIEDLDEKREQDDLGLETRDSTRIRKEKSEQKERQKRSNRERQYDEDVEDSEDELTEDELDQLEEGLEQLDELSKALLGRYLKKAKNDYGVKQNISGFTTGVSTEADRVISRRKIKKRHHGIDKAIDKLTKEEVSVDDVLDYTLNNDMVNLNSAIDSIMQTRISNALEDRKQLVAGTFNNE